MWWGTNDSLYALLCMSECESTPCSLCCLNIDASCQRSLPRTSTYHLDGRISKHYQLSGRIYKDNVLDRGHIARRTDVVWGPKPVAERANYDSNFYTNIAPQHQSFNQSGADGIWRGLEDRIESESKARKRRLSVLGGPILRADDPEYREVLIPQSYWKLVSYRAPDGRLSSAAFILSQTTLMGDLREMNYGDFKLLQVPLGKLRARTGLSFDAYSDAEVSENAHRAQVGGDRLSFYESGEARVRRIESLDDIVF